MPIFSDKVLDDLQKKSDKALENVSLTSGVVEELTQALEKINERIKQYEKWRDQPIPAKDLTDALKGNRFKSQARKILIKEVEKAITASKEFDLPLFRKRLMTAIMDERTIQVVVTGDGTAEIRINLAQTAGTVKDWYNAAKEVRRKEGFGKSRQGYNDVVADMWAEKIYDVDRKAGRVTRTHSSGKVIDITARYKGKYFETIRKRVNALASLAPWWEFLEHGTGFEGKGKGYPYPNYAGYRFVENTQRTIQTRLDGALKHFQNAQRDEVDRWIREANEMRQTIIGMINSLAAVGEVPARVQPFGTAAVYNRAIKETRRLTRQYLDTIRKIKYGKSIFGLLDATQMRRVEDALVEGIISGMPSPRMWFIVGELGERESLRYVNLTRELASRLKEQGINIQALRR